MQIHPYLFRPTDYRNLSNQPMSENEKMVGGTRSDDQPSDRKRTSDHVQVSTHGKLVFLLQYGQMQTFSWIRNVIDLLVSAILLLLRRLKEDTFSTKCPMKVA